MKDALAYVRVSSREQKQEGYSIPAQKKLLADYAKANDFNVVKEFEDDETAKSTGRTGFGQMIEYIKDNPDVKTILVEKTDRLYRNFKDYVTIDELGVTVFLVKENEQIGQSANSHQKFMHGIKVLMAKNYIDNLSEEVKKGQKQKAESGFFPGTPPVGYKLKKVEGKSKTIIDEKNKYLPIKMFEYYATGAYSLITLIDKVKSEGLMTGEFPHHSKMQKLTKATAQRILRNPFYYGDFVWSGKIYKGKHKPLISRDLWDKVQSILGRYENKCNAYKYKDDKSMFPFKRFLTCGECGRNITAEKKVKPSGKEYIYYRCTKFNTNCAQKAVNEKALEEQIENSLEGLRMPTSAQKYITAGLKQSFNLKRDTEDKTRQNLERRKKKLEERLAVLYEDRLDKVITPEFYQEKFNEYSKEITGLDTKISRYTQADLDYYQLGVKILELSNNLLSLYKNAFAREKHELFNFLLSNSTLRDGKLLISYKKPFDLIHQRVKCSDVRE
ncbi:MAG: recombinase family protein [Patescibacteria group bacterium]|nr:recombinase family protein [Patescibacteria group bacterium]